MDGDALIRGDHVDGITVEGDTVVWRLGAKEAEDLAYILMRSPSWEQDGHLLLEAALTGLGVS